MCQPKGFLILYSCKTFIFKTSGILARLLKPSSSNSSVICDIERSLIRSDSILASFKLSLNFLPVILLIFMSSGIFVRSLSPIKERRVVLFETALAFPAPPITDPVAPVPNKVSRESNTSCLPTLVPSSYSM